MSKRLFLYASVPLILWACEDPPAFNPAPESYGASEARIEGVAETRTIASVDSTFFGRNLPMLGRRFAPHDYGEGNDAAVLTHAFWMEHFGERPDVIGSMLEVDGVARTIVGVMPPGVDVPPGVVLWVPRK